ncbi:MULTISPECIES: biotin/lipoyl-containing protein [Pandoraea]|uniref:acetyl-CoA carboxylase biotin carboxyl carrier protein n=1 Tax=Pandoraea TaxID=93217 RepID=UPI001F5C4C24|nr:MULTISPECIES: biotin/lipoyl-containing protein [Pandoraea]MCI3208732.1 acetyl-CoA carboxylase biotin carboxyl carrier protein subunit [Pandoraea sp. LA3]MDN4586761.1 acetyl-CoA carboxylase biotin carboxyl carrier protein subunit [Pandoraea capi]
MNHEALAPLLRLLEGTSVSEIEHDDGRTRIRLTRQVRGGIAARAPVVATAAPIESVPTEGSQARPMTPPPVPAATRHTVTAGLVGTFYRASAPDQPPFVSVGDVVQEGQTLAIVEAMKLLNSIDADRAGRLVEIAADDGTAVTPDTVLFVIEPLETEHV